MKNPSRILLILGLGLLLSPSVSAEDFFDQQWFTMDFGLGYPAIILPDDAQQFLEPTGDKAAQTNVSMNFHLDIGIPLGRGSVFGLPPSDQYLVLATAGYARGVDYDQEKARLANHLYDVGLQSIWGPFSVKLLAGAEYAEGDHSIPLQNRVFRTGLGPNAQLKAGYYFNTTKGLGVGVGLVADTAWLDSAFYGQVGVEASLTYF